MIFSTKLTAIFAPIRSVCSYQFQKNTAKGRVHHSTIARTDLRRKRGRHTHEEIEVFQNTKTVMSKHVFAFLIQATLIFRLHRNGLGEYFVLLTNFKYLRRKIHLMKNFTRIKSVAFFIVQNFLYSTCIRHSA